MAETSTVERRKHQRFPLKLPAQLQITTDEKEVWSLQTANISGGGAFFRVSTPLPFGTPVKLCLILPLNKIKELRDMGQAILNITGMIVRSEEAGMSMKFDKHFEILPGHYDLEICDSRPFH